MKEIPSHKLNLRNDIVYEVNSQTPFTGNEVQHYDTGEILFKACYKDGKREGESISYYFSGQWNFKGKYKKGKLNGPYEEYYENGQLETKSTYKNGLEDGTSETYYENGQLKNKVPYKNGALDGTFKTYYYQLFHTEYPLGESRAAGHRVPRWPGAPWPRRAGRLRSAPGAAGRSTPRCCQRSSAPSTSISRNLQFCLLSKISP